MNYDFSKIQSVSNQMEKLSENIKSLSKRYKHNPEDQTPTEFKFIVDPNIKNITKNIDYEIFKVRQIDFTHQKRQKNLYWPKSLKSQLLGTFPQI